MQAPLSGQPNQLRNVGYFMIAPVTAVILLIIALSVFYVNYNSQHNGRIFPGVSIMGVDVSDMSPEEAQLALSDAFPYAHNAQIVLTDPATQQQWVKTPAELGMKLDAEQTVQTAYEIGRSGNPVKRASDLFSTWYYGRSLTPVLTLDEGQLNNSLNELAGELNQTPINATFELNGEATSFNPGQAGRSLDVYDVRTRLITPLTNFQPAEVELLVHEVQPTLYDSPEVTTELQRIVSSPVTFYLQEPLDEFDLEPITLNREQIASWVRVDTSNGEPQVIVDENAVRHWLRDYDQPLAREPQNARFYFDDDTEELVLVAPHVNGRELDIEATLAQFLAQVETPNRSVPFVVNEIVPVANSEATAVDLGITELITETTTWFYGSSDARKHNIATAASNFYGIVVNPYETFSFNDYLGNITEADGYTEGFIIVGGQTIQGVGGGICQVSTTLYQTAFFAGYPIVDRTPHGYMLGYYRDGAGHGMDATIYSPIVDMRFTNNTPYHLLIENYYNEELEALTFKFYSTSMGRTVVKGDPVFENVTEVPTPEEDRWVFREDLPPGTVEQVDWATEGADVFITREVYNADGALIEERLFESNYWPVPNVFHYGPGVEPYDYSLVPDEDD